jgi:hypothetical protein
MMLLVRTGSFFGLQRKKLPIGVALKNTLQLIVSRALAGVSFDTCSGLYEFDAELPRGRGLPADDR